MGRSMYPLLFCWLVLFPVTADAAQTSQQNDPKGSESNGDTIALSVEGITSGSSEDNPGVLYILPWQPPTLPRRTRDALASDAPELLEPMDPEVFERHRGFQQSLNPRLDSSNP